MGLPAVGLTRVAAAAAGALSVLRHVMFRRLRRGGRCSQGPGVLQEGCSGVADSLPEDRGEAGGCTCPLACAAPGGTWVRGAEAQGLRHWGVAWGLGRSARCQAAFPGPQAALLRLGVGEPGRGLTWAGGRCGRCPRASVDLWES